MPGIMFRISFLLDQIFIVVIDGVISAYGRPGACFINTLYLPAVTRILPAITSSATYFFQLDQPCITQVMTLIGKAIRRYNTGNDLYRVNGTNTRETFLMTYLWIIFSKSLKFFLITFLFLFMSPNLSIYTIQNKLIIF